MEKLGLPFRARSPECDEQPQPDETHDPLVRRLAETKARSVAANNPDSLIIGSDQVAALNTHILGKPGNHARAVEQLQACSGQSVVFHTGLCLFDARDGTAQIDNVQFTVTFRALTTPQIERYLQAEKPYNCAGSFKSEGRGITLFSRLSGDDPNALVGLPLIRLCDMLMQHDIVVP